MSGQADFECAAEWDAMEKKFGIVYLVGAGPGDPELVTVKGAGVLGAAEVLVYDRLVSEELLKLVPDACERIYVGKKPGFHAKTQDEINRILVEKAKEGKIVVRLKGGDPFVFGRGGEEALELARHNIPCKIVPGVTSAIAAPAHAGIPVTHRGLSQSFHVITGHTADGKSMDDAAFACYARLSGTLVFLMGLSNLERITERLLSNGKAPDTPAAVVSNGTLAKEQSVRAPLDAICAKTREAGLKPPGILLVGGTAALHLNEKRDLPLAGVTVGVTGTDSIYERLSVRLSALGAEVMRAGRSRVERENEEGLLAALRGLAMYDWVVFTSRNAVRIFFETMRENRVDARILGRLLFAAVGSGTGELLEEFGIYADYIPKAYTTEALAAGLSGAVRPGSRLLLARARRGSEALPNILSAAGILCTELPIYDVVTEKVDCAGLERLSYLTFASSSGVHGFFAGQAEEKRRLLARVRPVCIGEVTAKALESYGITGALVAREYTAAGIAEMIGEDYGAVCL